MSLVVRLRIDLADRPGSLADVAAVIGAHGGNITSIDMLSAERGRVVDEITVEVPDQLDLTVLRIQIAGTADARVLSHQRAGVVDPIVRVLRRAAEAVDRVTEDPAEALRRAVADLCATPAAWILEAQDASAYEAGSEALAHPGHAIIGHTAAKLPPLGETVTGEASIVAVAVAGVYGPAVVLVARSLGQGFTPTEADRIEALVALHARLVGLVPAGGDRGFRLIGHRHLRVNWLDRERTLEGGSRLLETAQRNQRHAEAVVGQGNLGPGRSQGAEIRRSLFELAALLRHHPEKVQAADMAGVASENGAAMRFGVEQLAELVMPHGLREHGGGPGRAR